MVYMTAGDVEEARRIGRELVRLRLAACVNILGGMESIYLWQEKLETADEVVLIAKTVSEKVEELTETVKELHSYDCPCVVAFEADKGNDQFFEWIGNCTT